MSLETIYYIGQTIAVLAILCSLVAVFLQVRQQSQVSRSELYLVATSEFNELFRTFRIDPDFAYLYSVALQEWHALSRVQRLRLHTFNVEMAVHLDSCLTMCAQKLFDEEQLKPWVDNMLGVLITPGGAQWWNEAQFFFTPQLRDALNIRLQDQDSLPPPWTHFPPWSANSEEIAGILRAGRQS